MYHINARNVNAALALGAAHLILEGVEEDSRNGRVLVAPTPVTTTYQKPTERVLFSPARDANPFFHLMEAIWMIGGANDLQWPVQFNSRFSEYSDDGKVVHGAYGFRWRNFFGFDQLEVLAKELYEKPSSRRAVLTMWTPNGDLTSYENDDGSIVGGLSSKDVPCNTQAYFDLRGGVLNMTVTNRSNDAIWGAYGANAVHFSFLQEYLALWLGVPVGVYRQMSNNLHAYLDIYDRSKLADIVSDCVDDMRRYDAVTHFPIAESGGYGPDMDRAWRADIVQLVKTPFNSADYRQPFFTSVAAPMYRAWLERKAKTGDGLSHIAEITAPDWRMACQEWVARREAKKQAAGAA